MEIVLHALNGVLTIMLMNAVGFYLELSGCFASGTYDTASPGAQFIGGGMLLYFLGEGIQ